MVTYYVKWNLISEIFIKGLGLPRRCLEVVLYGFRTAKGPSGGLPALKTGRKCRILDMLLLAMNERRTWPDRFNSVGPAQLKSIELAPYFSKQKTRGTSRGFCRIEFTRGFEVRLDLKAPRPPAFADKINDPRLA
jgi:hypothetical protein